MLKDVAFIYKNILTNSMSGYVILLGFAPCIKSRMCAKSLQSTLCDPMDGSPPGSSSMGFPRQEHWSGLPCPPPGDLPDSGIEPRSPALAG